MAKSAQKIILFPSRDIPFDKLVLSRSNVRRIKAGISVEELAEDMARRGLLQSLSVRPVLDDDGAETRTYEIPVGGRRFQALSLLVKQKRLAKSAPISCIVRDAKSTILAEDDSLAENMQRAALHPLHHFRAFVALREKGQGDEEIAAAFFVTPQVVKQRLKLAAVAPALLELYAEDEMTLEQLMAFTVNPDHERQVQVWEAIRSSWNKEHYQIRRMLAETSVRASDRRAAFVGVEAYESARGTMLHDLFQGDDGGWLEDPALLDRLVSGKLQAEAEAIAAEGWKWIDVSLDLPERLIMELTALRTLALREAIGRSPDVALTLLLLKLVNDIFRTSNSAGNCLEAWVRHVYMSAQASDLKDSVVAKLIDERHAEWEADLPLGDDAALWDYLTSLDQASALSLLAHSLSFGINALHEKVNPYSAGISASGLTKQMTQPDLVAQAVELDMVEAGWEPTADTYLNRVPKVRILEAVREAKGEGTAQLLDHLKKGEMATADAGGIDQSIERARTGDMGGQSNAIAFLLISLVDASIFQLIRGR
ncbi:ParB/RepB/Spo0J family partition protein [Marivita sp. S0852]|uniref:ParB/RepB/Spo0J family partition protein n=1 Tax=Marivita sp. S0852 TaxID=3373893 RepID=UPI003982A233